MAVVVAALAIAFVAFVVIAFVPFQNGNSNTNSSSVGCASYHTSFLVIADGRGFNDSIDHGVPQNDWPILCVHHGDNVTIRVENSGNEPHGFAIAHYYEGGIALAEGQTVTVNFVADETGSFSIKCNILCSVHPWMLSGVLVVG